LKWAFPESEPGSAPGSKAEALNRSLAKAVIKLGSRVQQLEEQVVEMQQGLAALARLAETIRGEISMSCLH
jgi:hypothetical protein